jgi:hypothetical protein
VRFLLDEMLDGPGSKVAKALDVFGDDLGCSFQSLVALHPGLQDQAIPELCRGRGIDALVTVNVRDFGARLPLYEAMLAAGVSVVVLRPFKKVRLTPSTQASILIRHLARLASQLREASSTALMTVSDGGMRVIRGLRELAESLRDEPMSP